MPSGMLLLNKLQIFMDKTWNNILNSIDEVKIATASVAVILLFLISAILFLSSVLMLLCCAKRPKRTKNGKQKEVLCKKGLFALMLARLDEFDSLTPLIVTPGTPLDAPNESGSFPLVPPPSSSPPPPRRTHGGKTLIVPLNTGRYRPPPVPLLGTPDSRVTTFETGTTKSCATIPEDDEEETHLDDLVSIDRTSFSTSTDVKSQRYYFFSSYNLQIPNAPPDFQLPAPPYEPPPPPLNHNDRVSRPIRLRTTIKDERVVERVVRVERDKKKSPETQSGSSLGSPQSSLGSGSPIDTTGSLSDSFYIDSNYTAHPADPDQATEVDPLAKYQLHRIEEESEHYSEERIECGTTRVLDTHGMPANMARSISQQFELMQRR